VLGVQWHHTASSTSPASDLSWMISGSSDRPLGNVLLDRDGAVWPVAAGAANTAGQGGPLGLSRGTIAANCANTASFAIEAANAGTGEPWPQVQIDAYFALSNALNAYFGNAPGDVFTHALGAGDGWTDRKIDPATAAAVQGPWKPRSINSSGTWNLDDMRTVHTQRWAGTPPTPPEDEMTDADWTRFTQIAHDQAVQAIKEQFAPSGEAFQRLSPMTLQQSQAAINASLDAITANVWALKIDYAKQQADGPERNATEPASSVLSAAASYSGRAAKAVT